MKLEDLIKELEKAQGMATEWVPPPDGGFTVHGYDGERVASYSDGCGQAIAIRHNTARVAIRYLRDVHWTNCVNHEYGESQKRLVSRVKKAETRAAELEAVACLSTSNLHKRYKKNRKQSPFGYWHAAPVGSDKKDWWVENALGKYVNSILAEGG